MDKAIFAGFAALLVLAPIPLGSNRDWPQGVMEAWIALLFTLWLLREAVGPGPDQSPVFKQNKAVLALIWLLPLYITLQLVPWPGGLADILHETTRFASLTAPAISVDTGATVSQLQKSLAFAMFFTLTLGIVNTPARLEATMKIVVLSGVLQAVYGVLVVLGGKPFDFFGIRELATGGHAGRSATGTFVNRNSFAGHLQLCLAVGIGLMVATIMASKDPYLGWRAAMRRFLQNLLGGKFTLRVLLALMVVALVLSHSRMGNAAFFASLGVSAIAGLLLYRKKRNSKQLVVLFGSLIAIDILILGSWFGLDKLATRLEGTTLSHEERIPVFEASWLMLQDVWRTGTGAGSFETAFTAYRNNQIWYEYIYTHNDYLQFATEYGVAGLLIFGLIVALCFYRGIRAQVTRHTAIYKGAGFAAMMGITSLMIHSWTDYNLQIPSTGLLFTLLCAMACIAYGAAHEPHGKHSRSSST